MTDNKYLVIFTVVAVFTGFMLGYSVPPILEIKHGGGVDEVSTETQDTGEGEDLSDYYKELQQLQ